MAAVEVSPQNQEIPEVQEELQNAEAQAEIVPQNPKENGIDESTEVTEHAEAQAEDVQQAHKENVNDEKTTEVENTEAHAEDIRQTHKENGFNKKTPEPEHTKDDKLRKDSTPRKYARVGRQSDLTMQEETSDPKAIRRQVEFYFSDSNLPNDKYLFNLVGGTKNDPIELQSICTFKRMRRFQPFEAVVDALKHSQTVKVFQGDDEKWMIQRKVPLPETMASKSQFEARQVFESAALARSVYVKGFGIEKPSTQFDIEAFFADFGHTNAVRLRRIDDKTFKGSVFVEFESEEKAQEFLNLDPAPTYHGNPLIIKSKKDYIEGKPQHSRRPKNNEQDWRQRREDDRKHGRLDFRNQRGGKNQQGQRGNDARNKRSRDDSNTVQNEEPVAKKVEIEGSAPVPDVDEVLADVAGTEGGEDVANGEQATKIKESSDSEPVEAT